MPVIQVVGDPDTGGGVIETPLQNFVKAGGQLISVNGTAVTDHPPDHTDVHTDNGSSFVRINGIAPNFVGNADTCGHTRSGTTMPWLIIQS